MSSFTYCTTPRPDLDKLKTTVKRVLATLPQRRQLDELVYLQGVLAGRSEIVQAHKLCVWLAVNGGSRV